MIRKRYMLGEFFFLLLAVNLSFLALFLVVQIVSDLPEKLQAKSALNWENYLWQMPLIFVQLSPVLTFLASLFLLTEMMKRNEIRVLELSGIFPLRIYDMLLAGGLFSTLVVFLVNETVSPVAYRRIKPLTAMKSVQLCSPTLFLYCEHFFPPDYVENIQVSQVLPEGDIFALTAKKAWFRQDFWLLGDGHTWKFNPEGRLTEEAFFRSMRLNLPVTAQMLAFLGQSLEGCKIKELLTIRRQLVKIGLSAQVLNALIQERFAYPLLNLFFILASLPFFFWRQKLSRFFVISFSFLFSFCCYFLYSTGIALAKNGQLPVVFGVWMVHILVVVMAGVYSLMTAAGGIDEKVKIGYNLADG